MRRAVIDIGTNSVKLLVADVSNGQVDPVREESEQTRLGAGFYSEHRLQPDAITRTAEAVVRFCQIARSWKANSLRVIATSAARDAVNQDTLVARVKSASGLDMEVISGEQEAEWAFLGVCTDPQFAKESLLILDVGGGSTEFIAGNHRHRTFQQSFPIGTVRLLEQVRPSDPPLETDWIGCERYLESVLEKEVRPRLLPALARLDGHPVRLVGTGGTSAILASIEMQLGEFDRAKIEQTLLGSARVWHYQKLLWSMPLQERRLLCGLPPNRADVILFGVAVFAVVMRSFGLEELRISTRGIRFAAVLTS
jgi:exopolyphosphatase/guanosine-5'-triphosphate,3'-diphosphate pyrophosphatase